MAVSTVTVEPPPHEVEVEAALLGACFVNDAVFQRVRPDCRQEYFYEPVHGRIWAGMEKLADEGKAVSPLALKAHFDGDPALSSVGGGRYLFDLAANAITTVNAEDYVQTLADCWQRREMLPALQDAIDALHEVDIDRGAADIGSAAIHRLSEVLTAGRSQGKARKEVLRTLVEDLQKPVRAESTGLWQLDNRMAGGLHRGRAYGIVGRKKVGKSALGGTISYSLNNAGVPHLAILLEMGSQSYEQRNVARALGVNSLLFLDQRQRSDTRFLGRVAQYAQTAKSSAFYLDRPGLTFDELRRQVVYFAHRHKVAGVILDYLQLVGGRKERRTQAEHLDEVAQWIAEAVKNLDIWFLCLAQENQDGNVRGGEGMRLAFDQIYAIRSGAASNTAYLEMWDSRYTPQSDVGTVHDPAFDLPKEGPYFREIALPPVGLMRIDGRPYDE